VQPVGLIFKGSGWHITDYGRGNGRSGLGNRRKETSEEPPSVDKALDKSIKGED